MKYKNMHLIFRIYKLTFKCAPISGIVSPIYYLIKGLFPAYITYITTILFDVAHDYIVKDINISKLYFVGTLLLIGYILKYVLECFSSVMINAGVYEKCVSYQRIELAKKAAKLSLIDYENNETMNCYSRAQNCVSDEKLSSIYMSLAVLITSGIGVISVSLVLVRYNILFLVVAIFSVLPYFIVKIIRGKEFYYLKYFQTKKNRKRDYLWQLLTEKNSLKEMQVMGFGDYIKQKWYDINDEVNNELWIHHMKDAKSLFLCDLVRTLGYIISIGTTIYLTLRGDITVGVFAACLVAFTSVQDQVKQVLIDFSTVVENLSYANDFFIFLDLPESNNDCEKFMGFNQCIEAKNISFTYPNVDSPVLDNISFKINKGETVAIIGENGSGKTTLSKIILGLYPIEKGEILYDGFNLQHMDKDSFYRIVSIVSQNFTVYKLRIRDNITLSDIKNKDNNEKISKTLNQFGLSDINVEMIDKQVGREFDGVEFSGGQSQRMALARALFKESELIILDEPTSALDPLIENEVLSNFIEISKGRTSIIISHRVGLCRLVNKIIVMKVGRIVEIGNHDELINHDGEYKRLYEAQQKWYI